MPNLLQIFYYYLCGRFGLVRPEFSLHSNLPHCVFSQIDIGPNGFDQFTHLCNNNATNQREKLHLIILVGPHRNRRLVDLRWPSINSTFYIKNLILQLMS